MILTLTPELCWKLSHMSSTKKTRPSLGKRWWSLPFAPAAPEHIFAAGDAAILLYERKHRVYNVPVTIVHACWSADERFTTEKPTAVKDDVSYLVRSAQGGELTVPSAQLRPGSILDRIVTAIEFDVDPD